MTLDELQLYRATLQWEEELRRLQHQTREVTIETIMNFLEGKLV